MAVRRSWSMFPGRNDSQLAFASRHFRCCVPCQMFMSSESAHTLLLFLLWNVWQSEEKPGRKCSRWSNTTLMLPFSVLSVPKPQDFYFLLLGCDHRRKISHICSCANQRMIYSLDYKATNKLLHSPNSYLIFRARWDPSNQRKTGRCGSCLLCLVYVANIKSFPPWTTEVLSSRYFACSPCPHRAPPSLSPHGMGGAPCLCLHRGHFSCQPPSWGSSTFLLLVKTSDRLPGHSWRKYGQLWVSEPETESISGLLNGSSVFTLPASAVCSREKKRP